MLVNFDVLLIVKVKNDVPTVMIFDSDLSSFEKEVVKVGKEVPLTVIKSSS